MACRSSIGGGLLAAALMFATGPASAFDDANYQEKIRNAHDWANKYFSPSQSDQFGGRDMVRSHLLQELESAAQEATELERG